MKKTDGGKEVRKGSVLEVTKKTDQGKNFRKFCPNGQGR